MENPYPIRNPKEGESFTTIDELIIDQGVVVDKQQIANPMNDHLCNIGNKLKLKIPDYGRQYMDYILQRIANSFYLKPAWHIGWIERLKQKQILWSWSYWK